MPRPKNPIPITPVELLALKHGVLREEKNLQESLERIRAWSEERGLGRRPQSPISMRTDTLVERIGGRIDAFSIEHRLLNADSIAVAEIEDAMPATWGVDGA